MKRELCAQAQVRHPGLVQVLDQNTETTRPYYVLELLHGSLKGRLEEGGGTVKPENVLFDLCGNAKLGDFGLPASDVYGLGMLL